MGTAGAGVLASSGRQVHLGQSRWGRGPGWCHSLGHRWVPDHWRRHWGADTAGPPLETRGCPIPACLCRRPSPGQAPGPRVARSTRSSRKQRKGPVIAGPLPSAALGAYPDLKLNAPLAPHPTGERHEGCHPPGPVQGTQRSAGPPLSRQLAGTRMGPGRPEPCSELRPVPGPEAPPRPRGRRAGSPKQTRGSDGHKHGAVT